MIKPGIRACIPDIALLCNMTTSLKRNTYLLPKRKTVQDYNFEVQLFLWRIHLSFFFFQFIVYWFAKHYCWITTLYPGALAYIHNMGVFRSNPRLTLQVLQTKSVTMLVIARTLFIIHFANGPWTPTQNAWI